MRALAEGVIEELRAARGARDLDRDDDRAAARRAAAPSEIAEYADFFSFGTNDLTQTTLGFSRDDAEGVPAAVPRGRRDRAQPVREHRRRRRRRARAHRRPSAARSARPGPQARHLRRARRRSGLGRVLPPGRPRLRLVLAVPRADRAPGGRPRGARRADERAASTRRSRPARRSSRATSRSSSTPSAPRRRRLRAAAGLRAGDLLRRGRRRARSWPAGIGPGRSWPASASACASRASTSATRRASSTPAQPLGDALVLTTTNGTRAVVRPRIRADTVLIGSLANLTACAAAAARRARQARPTCACAAPGCAARSRSTTPTRRAGSSPRCAPTWRSGRRATPPRRPGERGGVRVGLRRAGRVAERPRPACRRPHRRRALLRPRERPRRHSDGRRRRRRRCADHGVEACACTPHLGGRRRRCAWSQALTGRKVPMCHETSCWVGPVAPSWP